MAVNVCQSCPGKTSPSQSCSDASGSTGGTPDCAFKLEKNVTRWELVPVVVLELLLRSMEPAVFTEVNVKCISRRGAREANQKLLMKYVELMTNFSPYANIPPGLREGALVKVCCDMNIQNGRRARDLVLPCNFAVDGFYRYELEDRELWITSPFLKTRVKVAGKYDPKTVFTINENWSEMKAELHEEGGFFQQPLYILFHSQELAKKSVTQLPPPPKPSKRKSLTNGDDDEEPPKKTRAAAAAQLSRPPAKAKAKSRC